MIRYISGDTKASQSCTILILLVTAPRRIFWPLQPQSLADNVALRMHAFPEGLHASLAHVAGTEGGGVVGVELGISQVDHSPSLTRQPPLKVHQHQFACRGEINTQTHKIYQSIKSCAWRRKGGGEIKVNHAPSLTRQQPLEVHRHQFACRGEINTQTHKTYQSFKSCVWRRKRGGAVKVNHAPSLTRQPPLEAHQHQVACRAEMNTQTYKIYQSIKSCVWRRKGGGAVKVNHAGKGEGQLKQTTPLPSRGSHPWRPTSTRLPVGQKEMHKQIRITQLIKFCVWRRRGRGVLEVNHAPSLTRQPPVEVHLSESVCLGSNKQIN